MLTDDILQKIEDDGMAARFAGKGEDDNPYRIAAKGEPPSESIAKEDAWDRGYWGVIPLPASGLGEIFKAP